ncbi:hypothetical protein [Pseudorhodoferax sp. Leaf265]|uniref:hypothetical protein n=1 Tax=Pseudorhodoferax sp. Leaf265 TaxID=1736315 RepID=UPI0006F7B8A2|nr:hypothetical protein [Pseudorhodoferax sp. Leaf265]KQP02508.1 hypothetical protein ASF45_20865 [Pseudorhodoferax sp. Leaf265]
MSTADQTPSMPPLPGALLPLIRGAAQCSGPAEDAQMAYITAEIHSYAQAVADEREREALKLAGHAISDLQSELARSDSPINGEYVAAMHFGDRARAAIRALARPTLSLAATDSP